MSAAALISEAKGFQCLMSVQGERLQLKAPEPLPGDLLERLKQARDDVVRLIQILDAVQFITRLRSDEEQAAGNESCTGQQRLRSHFQEQEQIPDDAPDGQDRVKGRSEFGLVIEKPAFSKDDEAEVGQDAGKNDHRGSRFDQHLNIQKERSDHKKTRGQDGHEWRS